MPANGPETRQEEDVIRTETVALVGVGALVVFALGVLTAAWQLSAGQHADLPLGPAPIPAQVSQTEVGIVYQRTFDELAPGDGERLHRSQRQLLASYGWIDPKQGTIHVPIEVAMRRYLDTVAGRKSDKAVEGQKSKADSNRVKDSL